MFSMAANVAGQHNGQICLAMCKKMPGLALWD